MPILTSVKILPPMPYLVKIAEKLNMQGILAQFISFYPKWGGGSFLKNIYIGPRGAPPPLGTKKAM